MALKAIKLTIHQETANYRVPNSHLFRESYPLPPYSTVIGMIHYLCDFKSYHEMKLSIGGDYASTVNDMYTRYEFKNGYKFDSKRHQLNVEGFGVSRGIGYTQLLVDVNLVIHIVPDNQNEVDEIYQALKYPKEYPNLGRREDLVNITSIKIVDLKKKQLDEDFQVKKAYYLNFRNDDDTSLIKFNDVIKNGRGTYYDINKTYELTPLKRKQYYRKWKKVHVLYISDFELAEDSEFLFDDEREPVFFSMMEFLAKSNGETLIDHTNNLLSQLKILKNTYPEILTRSDWELLQLACAYHDLGKINDKFQEKIRKNKWHIDGEIPHGLLSITLIPRKELEKNFSEEQIWVLINSVARHHKRDFEKINASDYKEEVDSLKPLEKELAKRIDKLKAPLELQDPKKVSHKYFNFKSQLLLENELKESDEDELKIRHKFDEYVKIKGLLNRLDYAASGHYKVESSPRVILSQNILQHWRKSEPQANWNEMQKWTFKHQNKSIIVIGQTGLGKTEAALRWLGNEKSFFVLPLKSAINAIYHRIKNVVFNNESYNSLGLIHSDMISEAITEFGNQNNYSDFQKYVEEEKQWSKQLSIATLDQVFSFVYHYSNYEPQMATLAYSKVVIDEIQMYSPTLLAYIIYGLKEIQRYGGKFEIMTATLAPFILDLLNIHGLKFTMPEKPFLDSKINHRHNVKTIHAQLESKDILEKAQGKKTLVVCNTVQKANKLYLELKEVGVDVHLIHSRFIRKDRSIKENEIIHAGKTTNHNFEVWIGTQVVEASLDIDFDLLLTELSELNGLFQRMGRCYRKRNYKGEDPNVYIFDGGNKATSGIKRGQHSIVDWTMFSISKNAVKNLNGVLTEQDKIDLINTNYTSEKISVVDDNFISRVENSIKYLQDIEEAELIKKDIVSRFRGINNVDVIPEQVYLDNKVEITDKLIQLDRNKQKIRVLYKNENKNSNDITKLKIENLKLKNYLNSMTVSFPVYLLDKSDLVKNGDLQEVGYIILSKAFNYNSETGLSLNKSKEEEDDNFI